MPVLECRLHDPLPSRGKNKLDDILFPLEIQVRGSTFLESCRSPSLEASLAPAVVFQNNDIPAFRTR